MSAAKKPETPETNAANMSGKEDRRDVDVVAAVSYDKDGKPDQTPDFKVLGDDVEIREA